MNEMLRYTIIRVILFVMGGFLVRGCSDEDDVGNSGGTSKYGLIRMAEEDSFKNVYEVLANKRI